MRSHQWKVALSALLAGILLLAGCGVTPTPLSDPSDGSLSGPTMQPIVVPHRVRMTIVYCPDNTTSYPRSDFLNANRLVANWLDAAVTPNQDGAVAYVNLINSHSYQPQSTPLTIQIPPMPPDPSEPAMRSLAAPTGDPFIDAQRKAHVQAENTATMHVYQATLAHLHAQLAHVRAQVRQETDQLRRLNPPPDAVGTSVWGCIERAADRFSGVVGAKYLLLASDLEENEWVDYTLTYSLRGVHALALFYYCQTAPSCRAKSAVWSHTLLAAGATDVRFLDPAASPVQPNPFTNPPSGPGGAS